MDRDTPATSMSQWSIVLRTWMRGPDASGHPGDGPATGADDDRMSVNINRGIRLHLWTPPRS